VAVLATYGFCGVGTLVLLFVINAVFRIRAAHEEEILGLDLSQHSERAYAFGGEAVVVAGIAEPRPANVPPVRSNRFTIAVENIEPAAMMSRWRELCGVTPAPPPNEFKQVYSQVTTIRGNKFRFRGGDREQMRQGLQSIFRPVAPTVAARV